MAYQLSREEINWTTHSVLILFEPVHEKPTIWDSDQV